MDKDFRLLELVRIFQCPYVPNRWFVTHLSASLAHQARSKAIAYPKSNPSCVSHSTCRRLISSLGTSRIGCEVGQDFFERAERASNDLNLQAIHRPYIALHVFSVITNFCQPFRTSHCTVLCGNSTIYVKLFINCKHLSVGNGITASGSSGWCEYFNVRMCQTVGL